jgi:hypothetical protein
MTERDEAPADEAGAPTNYSGEKSSTKSTRARWGYEDPAVEAARSMLEGCVRAAKDDGTSPPAELIRAGVLMAGADPTNWLLLLGRIKRVAPGRAGALGQAVERRLALRLVALAGRRPRSVRWAWEGWVPLKAPTLLVGEPGQGKSTLLADLGARFTRGMVEGDLHGEPCGVVVCSAEDAIEEVLVPRLMAAGADLSRVFTESLAGKLSETGLSLPKDLEPLGYRIEEVGAKVLIIDPIVAYMAGTMDSHKDQHVRRVLRPLAQMAEDLGIAIIVVMHLNKSQTATALNRIGGSIGFVAAARSVLFLGTDPETDAAHGERVLAHAKSNYSRLASSLTFRLVDGGNVEAEDASVLSVPRVEWLGESDVSAADLIATAMSSEDGRTAREEAVEWIYATLADGATPAVQMLSDGMKAVGCGRRTLVAAKKDAGVLSRRHGDEWVWVMPDAETPCESDD